MNRPSITPDFSSLEVPQDAWSAPFWQGTAEHRLLMPRCTSCGTFRWPAGPFCPRCHAQPLEWVPAEGASIYSYTILPVRGGEENEPSQVRIPVLAEFASAPGVRLVSVLVDTPSDAASVGAPLVVDWLPAANAVIPVFRLASSAETRT